jgi:hypothetical protein
LEQNAGRNNASRSTGILLLEYINFSKSIPVDREALFLPAFRSNEAFLEFLRSKTRFRIDLGAIPSITDVYNNIINPESPAAAVTNTVISGTRRFASEMVDVVRNWYSFVTEAQFLSFDEETTQTKGIELIREPIQENSLNADKTFHNISEIVETLVEFAMAYDNLTNSSWNPVFHNHGLEIWRIDRPPRPHGGVSNWPSFRFATRLDAPPDRVLSLLFDSSKAHAINRYGIGILFVPQVSIYFVYLL